MASLLVPRPRAPRLDSSDRERVSRIVADCAAIAPLVASLDEGLVATTARRLFRRFVLEALVALAAAPDGELRANALARAMGLVGQSFANKARELVSLGLVERREDAIARPVAVSYRVTPRGASVGALACALTALKALQAEAALERGAALARADPRSVSPEAALATALLEARGFVTRFAVERRGSGELARYAETCVRKWHAEILSALAARPCRFGELRTATRAGDEALAHALRSLLALGAISRDGRVYAITAWGLADLALGSALLAVASGALQPP
ncbi:MAG: winged helix-turn-helix transcriptional regulator [Thermoplasmatota archaeon]